MRLQYQYIMITNQKRTCPQQHRHCKSDCTSHGQFACSLRKYSSSSSTKHFGSKTQQTQPMTTYQQLITRKKSAASIKPFKELAEQKSTGLRTANNATNRHNVSAFSPEGDSSQIQQLIEKVKLKPHSSSNSRNQSTQSANQQTKSQHTSQNKPHINQQISNTNTNTNTNPRVTEIRNAKHDELVQVKSKQIEELSSNVDRISKIIDMFNKKIKTQSEELNQSISLHAHTHAKQIQNSATKLPHQNQYQYQMSSTVAPHQVLASNSLHGYPVNLTRFPLSDFHKQVSPSDAVRSSVISVSVQQASKQSFAKRNDYHASNSNSNSSELAAYTAEKQRDKQNNGNRKQLVMQADNKCSSNQLNYRMFNMNIKSNVVFNFSKKK